MASIMLAETVKMAAAGAITYTAHYGSAQFYSEFCASKGLEGFLFGMITTASPVCRFALGIMSHSQDLYANFVMISMARIVVSALPTFT
jgi:hypothetical protein